MLVLVNFTWTPLNGSLSYTVDGVTYPYSHQDDAVTRASDARYAEFTTKANQLLTFTATVSGPSGFVVKEYKWNFGDGMVGYGIVTKHTYLLAVPQTQVTLIVKGSDHNEYRRTNILNLVP